MPNYYLAIDIGASSGRHILFWLEDRHMRMEEIYRFPNGISEQNGHLCWDYDALENHILAGMKLCAKFGKIPVSVGIDTWGVDFVLLDDRDTILGDTVCYRDHRTNGMDEIVSKYIPPEELYARTGIQKAIYNTIYQLMAVKQSHPEQLVRAKTFLMVPDYLHWRLCGRKANEYTEASTSQLLNPVTRDWDWELIDRLGYPREMFREIVYPGTVLGNLTKEIQEIVGFNCQVVLPAAHDTASAILAVPSNDPDTVFISSGTWSLMGVELEEPDCGEHSRECNFTNEGGYGGRICYLKNIMGLWMIQSVKKELQAQGLDLSYAELCGQAEKESIQSIVPCVHDRFLAPECMTEEIQRACQETGQPIPRTPAQIAAVVYRSLASCYGDAVSQLSRIRQKNFTSVSIIGGGSNAAYLNRLTAEQTGCTIYSGPAEATAIGNAVAQMLHSGELTSIEDAKKFIRRSFEVAIIKEKTLARK